MVYVIFGALAVALAALDQWVKAWTVSAFSAPVAPAIYSTADPARELWPGVVELTRVHNYGAAWSSFSGQRWLLLVVTSMLMGMVVCLLCRRMVRHPLGVAACMLVLSGGVGNLIDRIRLGYVVDMFHLAFWPTYPVFNVADICVVCGAVLGCVYYLWFYEKYDRKPKKGESDGTVDASGN